MADEADSTRLLVSSYCVRMIDYAQKRHGAVRLYRCNVRAVRYLVIFDGSQVVCPQ